MKLNCTTGEMRTTSQGSVVAGRDPVCYLASFFSQDDLPGVAYGSYQERDANAHLFAAAPDILRLLLDQEAFLQQCETMPDHQAAVLLLALEQRRQEMLARLKLEGVIE